MAISCGACGKLMRYTQAVLSCSGSGCKAMAHYACVASTRQDWRCVGCCYPTDISVQYLLGEILKKGSGLELLQGLIGKINDLLTDINAIRDENETLKKEICLLTNHHQNVNMMSAPYNKRKPQQNGFSKQQSSQVPVATIDLVSSEDETVQSSAAGQTKRSTSSLITEVATSSDQRPIDPSRKISIFVTWANATQSETYLKQYLQNATQVKSIECVRVSYYDTYSMFQIKVDANEAHLLNNSEVYPQGCKLELCSR